MTALEEPFAPPAHTRPPPRSLLPAEAYWSDDWYQDERRSVFAGNWVAAGSVEQLGAPGDAVVVDAGTDPIVVIRGDDGELRAFHNLCPHRGYRLVAHDGPVGQSLRCEYHFWNFQLDGTLRHVPQMEAQFPGLDKAAWCLRPAAAAEWEGMVFVHPDPAAVSFVSWLGGFPTWMGSHRPGMHPEVLHTEFAAACNWKLFVENHVDVLHLWYLHARTLETDHDRFEWWQSGPHWGSYEPYKERTAYPPRHDLPQLAGLDALDRNGVRANLIYPNIMIATTGDSVLIYQAIPTSPTTCTIDLRVRAAAGCKPEVMLQTVRPFLVEDIRAGERVQGSVRSSAFEVGPLGLQHEAPIERFHTWLRADLGLGPRPGHPGPEGGQR